MKRFVPILLILVGLVCATSVENLVSWTLGAVGIRSPLSPRRNEMVVYPEEPGS